MEGRDCIETCEDEVEQELVLLCLERLRASWRFILPFLIAIGCVFRVVVVSIVGWGGAKALLMAGGKYSVRVFRFWRVKHTTHRDVSTLPPFEQGIRIKPRGCKKQLDLQFMLRTIADYYNYSTYFTKQ